MELFHVPQGDSAHHTHTSVVKRLESPLELLRQSPRLTAVQQKAEYQAHAITFFVDQLDDFAVEEL
jgi:hypothetical protein